MQLEVYGFDKVLETDLKLSHKTNFMGLNESEMERLAIVKHLFEEGEESVNKPMPLANKSLIEFHDALELFMMLLLEKKELLYPVS
ncbi:MAG: hypothetical protein ABEJ72_03565 [Candidatus Aenigmatarchaeota archaeon]